MGGDSIFIPEYNPVVQVAGAVNAPVAVAYATGKDINDYLAAGGGFSRTADAGRAYVTQPSGKLQSVKRCFLLSPSNCSRDGLDSSRFARIVVAH